MVRLLHIDDWRYIQAAQGWIELGLFNEAADELENVSLPTRDHPECLETCWKIYAHYNRWTECWNIARAIIAQDEDDAMGYIQLACGCCYLE